VTAGHRLAGHVERSAPAVPVAVGSSWPGHSGRGRRTAETGEAGISQAALHAPDVIVLDLGLPDLDGLVVCKRIRTWSEVPIIVLSADGSEDRKVDALDTAPMTT
jgi:DNA-binding response OmpR family regulator